MLIMIASAMVILTLSFLVVLTGDNKSMNKQRSGLRRILLTNVKVSVSSVIALIVIKLLMMRH